MGERLCRDCKHFAPAASAYVICTPAQCKRTAYRDRVYGAGLVDCSTERKGFGPGSEFCGREGRFWEQRSEPVDPPKPQRRWWQIFGAQP